MPPPALLTGYRVGPVFHGQDDKYIISLWPPGECDTCLVRTNHLVHLFEQGNHHPSQPLQRHIPQHQPRHPWNLLVDYCDPPSGHCLCLATAAVNCCLTKSDSGPLVFCAPCQKWELRSVLTISSVGIPSKSSLFGFRSAWSIQHPPLLPDTTHHQLLNSSTLCFSTKSDTKASEHMTADQLIQPWNWS